MAAGRWVGRGDKNGGDGAAVDAMRALIGTVSMKRRRRHRRGREGRGADALQRRGGRRRARPRVRRRRRPDRRHHADGQGHAQRDRGHGGGRPRRHVRPVRGLLHGEARHRARPPPTSSTSPRRSPRTSAGSPRPRRARPATSPSCILDRPRHEQLVQEVREAGARIKFITDGDVAGAIAAAREGTGVDLLLGIGGTPGGHHRRLRAQVHGRRAAGHGCGPRTTRSGRRRSTPGTTSTACCTSTTWSSGDVFFVATGITDGELLRGVQYRAGGCTTQSLVMRSRSGTIRSIESLHSLEKLRAYSAVPFDRNDEQD